MKLSSVLWKVGVVIFSAFVVLDVLLRVVRKDALLSHWLAEASLILAALGSSQFAFGWPKFPRLLWRIFGPFFSLVVAWVAAWAVGWLATRLAIRPLTPGERLTTLGVLLLFLGYGLIVGMPLYRLGEWHRLGAKASETPEPPLIS